MIVVGIYGRMGSGKSEVARVFAENGAEVVEADLVGKEVVESSPVALSELVEAFGKTILTDEGKLDRRKLGEIAFSSSGNRELLNSIVHPRLVSELRRRIAESRRSGRCGMLVIDAALLLDWDLDGEVDVLVLVTAPEARQLKWAVGGRFSGEAIMQRWNAQMPERSLASKADIIIENTEGLTQLRQQAAEAYRQILVREKTD